MISLRTFLPFKNEKRLTLLGLRRTRTLFDVLLDRNTPDKPLSHFLLDEILIRSYSNRHGLNLDRH